MLLIECPYCGPRDETEFRHGGQAHVPYPADPDALSDREWAEYLFYRDNPRGTIAERWLHTAGCRNSITLSGGRRLSLMFQRCNSRQSYRGLCVLTNIGGKLVIGSPRRTRIAMRADSTP